jgi:hypothetical protein
MYPSPTTPTVARLPRMAFASSRRQLNVAELPLGIG